MAMLARGLGPFAIWAVVPLLGGLVVWLTYRLGRCVCQTHESAALAGVLVASSPVFLFQLMQPMSDVPAAAWWLFSIVAALDRPLWSALGSGLCASLAILTRPNLLPLVFPVGGYVWYGARESRIAAVRLALFGASVVPGALLPAAANAVFYGTPGLTGYGSIRDIYRPANALQNVFLYPHWLYQSHSLFIFAGFLVLLGRFVRKPNMEAQQWRRLIQHAWLGFSFVAVLFACYVFYLPFDHWTYLRFLLPGIPILIVLAMGVTDAIAQAFSPRVRIAILLFLVMVLPVTSVNCALRGDAFALKELFVDRYPAAAERIRASIQEEGVVICLLQSGSLRLYGSRMTVRYDLIPSDWLARGLAYLRQNGMAPYLAIENTELQECLTRFGADGQSILNSNATFVDPLQVVRLYGPIAAGK
jgi:hypothetical protein